MPELPEVETVRRGLEALLPGRKIVKVTHNWSKSFPNAPADVKRFLIGTKITTIRRRGKALIIDLDTDYSLIIHLKMTGQLVYVNRAVRFGAGHPNNSLAGRLPDKSTRVIFWLDKGNLYFNDQRKFGWIRLLPTIEVEEIDFFKQIGPEPLSADFTAKQFIARLARRAKTSVKAALLDQTVIAGVGNIYADEALFAAKIHPATLVGRLTTAKMRKLFTGLRAVLELSIEKGGSTDRNYVDATGKKGSYLGFAQVFRRDGQPCPRHPGTLIEKIRVAGRGTHICPKCQRLTK